MNMENTVVVVGGGPAGMFSASIAASRGKKVYLAEKNQYLGKKLLITGKGRCNITNSAPLEDFIANTRVNANFMYSAFYSFTNDDLIDFFEREGLEVKTERGGRVFPKSDKASDVRDVLVSYAKKMGVEFVFEQVKDIRKLSDGYEVVFQSGEPIMCSSVIIATGGLSYPKTGSTGDGYRFAKKFGHSIKDTKASLVPLVTEENFVSELMGLSLRNISIKVMKNGKEIYEDFGEMLFTHFGISGPVVLSASSHMKSEEGYTVSVDLKPALDFKTLDNRILRDFEVEKNKDFINSLVKGVTKEEISDLVDETFILKQVK